MKTRSDMSGLFRLLSVGLVLALSLMPQPLAAQAVTGTILGTVRDTSGGALPGATVTLTNSRNRVHPLVISDSSGEYTAPLMPTGTYTVTAELSGFRKVSLANVHVGVDQKVRADLKLDIGQMTESVDDRGRDAARSRPTAPTSGPPSPRSRSKRCPSTGATSSA